MGDTIAIFGFTAAAFLLFILGRRVYWDMTASDGRVALASPDALPPVLRVVLLRAAGLVAIAVCGWQYFGEDSSILRLMYEWNGDTRESLPLFLLNNGAFIAASYALYAHLRRSGFWREADSVIVTMACLPFLPLSMAANWEGAALLLQVLAYVLLREKKAWGALLAIAAQALDMRSIALLPVFALLSRRNSRSMVGGFMMVPIFLAQMAGRDFSAMSTLPDFTYYNVIGLYIPIALCILACIALCIPDYRRYEGLHVQWLLLLGGIAPFALGSPFLSFALPLALSLQRHRARYGFGVLLMLCANALYIAMSLMSPEVMHP